MILERLPDHAIPAGLGDFYDEIAQRAPSPLQQLMYRNPDSTRRFWRTVDLAGKTPSRRFCLELGCCEGMMTAELAKLFGYVDAVDISQVMLDRCQRTSNVRYHLGDAVTFEPPQPEYDLVVMSEILEHVHDPMAMIRRYTSIGRRVLATCPVTEPVNDEGAFDASLIGQEKRQGDATGHIWYMDMAGFLSWFDGLRIVHSERLGHSGIVLCESAT